jgi:hypothetical protein
MLNRERTSNTLTTANVEAAAALAGDILTVWGLEDTFEVTDILPSPPYGLEFTPRAPARLSAQDFIVVRAGSEFHGRYLLMESLNSALTVDADTDALRLRIAEVLIDFGNITVAVDSGTAGAVVDDGNGDGFSGVFTDSAATFIANGAAFGDRLRAIDGGSEERRTYVTEVISETSIRISPELPEDSYAAWNLERNSVSSSLVEVGRLKSQMQALLDVLVGYVLPTNRTIEGVLDLLRTQQLDKALDQLLDGNVSEFISLSVDEASYTSLARSSTQSAGATTYPSEDLQNQVVGKDPATGRVPATTSGIKAGTSSSLGQEEGVETRVALADGITSLLADEKVRALSQISFEELRNRAIYELVGEVESGVITDTDATLPWISVTGSIRERLVSRRERLLAALQYMIDNPDDFEEVV